MNICKGCENSCETPCAAAKALLDLYNRLRYEEWTEIIKILRAQLDLRDAEVADDLREMAEQIITKFPEFGTHYSELRVNETKQLYQEI